MMTECIGKVDVINLAFNFVLLNNAVCLFPSGFSLLKRLYLYLSGCICSVGDCRCLHCTLLEKTKVRSS